MYKDTPSGKRFIRVFDSKTGQIQCRRCKRRLPYGRKELLARAKVAIGDGLDDFLA